jgi:hypothetical protein
MSSAPNNCQYSSPYQHDIPIVLLSAINCTIMIKSMRYDIIITAAPPGHLKKILAHHIADNAAVSFQMALSMIEVQPIVYSNNILHEEMVRQTALLEKCGVRYSIKQSLPSSEPKSVPSKRTPSAQKSEKRASSIHTLSPVKKGFLRRLIGFLFGRRIQKQLLVSISVFILAYLLFMLSLPIIGLKNSPFGLIGLKSNPPGKASQQNSSPAQTSSPLRGVDRGDHHDPYSTDNRADAANGGPADTADLDSLLRFYSKSLARDRTDLTAWFGLIKAYTKKGAMNKVDSIEKEVATRFGPDVFAVKKCIEPFGEVQSVSSSNGVCRIRYLAASVEKNLLMEQTFQIIRALALNQNCQKISLFAATVKGSGLLVYIAIGKAPLSFEEYKKAATISYTE